ncbi:MAG: hypothetical protein V4738_11410 [Pseudomonadota bacterium]
MDRHKLLISMGNLAFSHDKGCGCGVDFCAAKVLVFQLSRRRLLKNEHTQPPVADRALGRRCFVGCALQIQGCGRLSDGFLDVLVVWNLVFILLQTRALSLDSGLSLCP